MPKKPVVCMKNINLENNQELLNSLLQGVGDRKYIIINYEWFYDYYKVLSMVSEEFTLRYDPDEATKGFIEITSFNNVAVVAKIPIIKTNINENILIKLKYIVPYSKYNNNFFVFIFDGKRISFRYTYNNKLPVLNKTNDSFFSLYTREKKRNEIETDDEDDFLTDDENDLDEDDEYDFELLDKIKSLTCEESTLSCLTEEEVDISGEQLNRNVNDELLKDVVCYLSIDFEHLKDIFNKLGKARLHVTIKNEIMTLTSMSSSLNKKTTSSLAVKRATPHEKEISFFILSKSITTFKSLSFSFSICPDGEKRIFKRVEFKVVRQAEDSYGITIFPGNFKSIKDTNINGFDLYNSIMIYIPEDK